MCSSEFTKDRNNANSMISNNEFYPSILCATRGGIATGLDSSDVKMIIRDGFYDKLIDSCQHVGRSRRGRNNDGSCLACSCHLISNMTDYV